MVEACLQVTLFLEDGSLLPRMGKESFTYVGLLVSPRALVTWCTSCIQSCCPQGPHIHLDTLHCLLCASRACSEYNSVDRLAIITWRRVEAQASSVTTSRRASVGQRFADESAAGCAFAKTEGA